jgi:uncharacterized membrane protein YobD (UPF0266 family)
MHTLMSANISIIHVIEMRSLIEMDMQAVGFSVIAWLIFDPLICHCNLVTSYMLKPVALLINHYCNLRQSYICYITQNHVDYDQTS